MNGVDMAYLIGHVITLRGGPLIVSRDGADPHVEKEV
jgi:hypothetical protein